jgi:hypothetical protein
MIYGLTANLYVDFVEIYEKHDSFRKITNKESINFSEDELKAYETVLHAFEKRMQEIDTKYQKMKIDK